MEFFFFFILVGSVTYLITFTSCRTTVPNKTMNKFSVFARDSCFQPSHDRLFMFMCLFVFLVVCTWVHVDFFCICGVCFCHCLCVWMCMLEGFCVFVVFCLFRFLCVCRYVRLLIQFVIIMLFFYFVLSIIAFVNISLCKCL